MNNANVELISAGIEYAKGPSDLTLLATKSDTNYGNRGAAANIVGLANTVVFHTFNLTYVRQINDNLSVTGQVGLVGVSNDFSRALPKTLLPIYSIEGSWSITPKLRLGASASRVVTPPTTVIANAQVAYNTIVSLTYQLTPKVSLTASGTAATRTWRSRPGWPLRSSGLRAKHRLLYGQCRRDLCDDPLPQRRAYRDV